MTPELELHVSYKCSWGVRVANAPEVFPVRPVFCSLPVIEPSRKPAET